METVPDHISPPNGIELKPSQVNPTRIGAYCVRKIPKDAVFGPYSGKIVYDQYDEAVDPKYSWELFDLETFKFLHTVDATNPADGNWMRYVCCARFFEEQNIVSTQDGAEVFYKTLKDIQPGHELLTWFQPKKKKRKKSLVQQSTENLVPPKSIENSSYSAINGTSGVEKGKRKRKPKIIPDSYDGPLEYEVKKSKPVNDDMFEPLQPGQKRRRRKKISADSRTSSTASLELEASDKTEGVKVESAAASLPEGAIDEDSRADSVTSTSTPVTDKTSSKDGKKENGAAMSISEINSTVDWIFPPRGCEYYFELKNHHVEAVVGRKVYKCDICMGLYKHMFSLKRHYLRNHVNYKYLSKADMTNCLINLAQVVQNMKERGLDTNCNSDKTHGAQDNNDTGNVKQEEKDTGDKTETATGDTPDNVVESDVNGHRSDQEDIVSEQERDCDNESGAEAKEESKCDKTSDICEDKLSKEDNMLNYSNGNINPTVTDSNDTLDKSSSDSVSSENNTETENSVDNSEPSTNQIKKLFGDMPGLFRCYTCYEVFDSVETVREHVQNHPKQEDGTCFSCDKCNMRFNYKQNLVRHQQVHKREGSHGNDKDSEDEASLPGSETGSVTSSEREPARLGFGSPPIQSSMYQVFKCNKCKTKFESLEAMTTHVQAEHITGNQFQCQYCGKEFPSMPNMKKHVRFHLGYRVSCRLCSDVFPNVGALRKHTRLAHTEVYKAKQLEKLENNKKLEVKVNSEKPVENKLLNSHASLKPSINNTKPDKPEESFAFDHDISFAADEIDDGGSRFKFSCTVCKKRFSNYINMCRHRRKSHSNDSKPRHEELSLNFNRNRSRNLSPVTEDPEEVARFFANVSHNIATNLNCYIDGHQEALEKFVDHIKIENYTGSFGYNQAPSDSANLPWENYNFPPDFQPVKVVAVPEASEPQVISDTVIDIPAENTPSTESEATRVEDNSTKASEVPDTTSEQSKVVSESDDMGTMAGLKNLASAAAAVSEKIQRQNSMERDASDKYIRLKITGGTIQKAPTETQTFMQVENGEYANFEDDLTPSDISCMERPESRAKEKFEQFRESGRKKNLGQSCESVTSVKGTGRISPTNHQLFSGAAQAELSDLYDCIDSPVEDLDDTDTTTHTNTPLPLSVLCENVLGLKPGANHKKDDKLSEINVEDSEDFKNESALLSELSLASQRTASMKLINGTKRVVPDYSDVPDGSPFYNYDSIAFGSNGEVASVCAICRRHFKDIEGVLRHHWKKHAGSVFQILEVEEGHEIDSLHFTQPSYVGALAVTDLGLDSLNEMETFSCTKCGNLFRSVSKLHVHIVNCSPIDPVNGFSKIDKSPSKTSLTKRIQRKFNNLLATDQLVKAKMFAMRNGLAFEPKSRKRMFTGCRKRKSVLLPDSPIKTALLTAHLSDLRTGYNPHRHIRRRELTELIDTLTCEACGLKFKTIILLERHVKNCTKKEKFKNVQPLACPIMDESLARIKNICFYCEKNFTYTKSLINHFQDFCPVKKAKMDRGDLSANDKLREDEIVDRLKRMEDEKLAKDAEHVKKKITWQVGRKPKRKGHSWTCIKKRKQCLSAGSLDNDGTEDGADNEEVMEEETEETPEQEDDAENDNENVFDTVDSVPEEKTGHGYDEVDSVSVATDVKDSVESNHKTTEKFNEDKGHIAKDYILPDLDELHESSVNDTSLNCTARYHVNQVVSHKQKKTVEAASKSSLLFQCVSNGKGAKGYEYEPLVQRRMKESSSLIIESKRKRERVGKVEEFLRNAFRRKRRSKKNDVSEETFESVKDDEYDSQAGDMASDNNNSNSTENGSVNKNTCDNRLTEDEAVNNVDPYFSGPLCDTLPPGVGSDRDGPRKRGRPRKIPVENKSLDSTGMPRKRGRPRKPPIFQSSKHSPFSATRGKCAGRPPHCYIPGQRGRPPKWKRFLWSLQKEGRSKHDNDPESVDSKDNTHLPDSGHTCDTAAGVEDVNKHQMDVKQVPVNECADSRVQEKTVEDIKDVEVQPCNEECVNAFVDKSSEVSKTVEEPVLQETNIECQINFTDVKEEQGSATDYTDLKDHLTEDMPTLEKAIPLTSESDTRSEAQPEASTILDKVTIMSEQSEDRMDLESSTETLSSDDYLIADPITEEESLESQNGTQSVPNNTSEIVNSVEAENSMKNVVDSIIDSPSIKETKEDVTHIEMVGLKTVIDDNGPCNKKDSDEVIDQCNDEVSDESNPVKTDTISTQDCDKQTDDALCDSPCKAEHSVSLKSDEQAGKSDKNKNETSGIKCDNETIKKSISSSLSDENEFDEKPIMTLPSSPEPSLRDWFPMVLSPSERVKMNKRSCTSREPNTPVWVKKPHKPKVKPVVSVDTVNSKSVSNIHNDNDNVKTDSNTPSQESDKLKSSSALMNKKPLFKKRVEAINENLKLLDKKVNSGYANSSRASVDEKPLLEDIPKETKSPQVSRIVANKGIKRKQPDDDHTDHINEKQAKRILVAEKIKKISDQVKNDTKSSKMSSKDDNKGRSVPKDKKTSKVKVGRR